MILTPQRYTENPRVSDASERLGHGHLQATERMVYNITQTTVKGK
jgi:hypothetical protein